MPPVSPQQSARPFHSPTQLHWAFRNLTFGPKPSHCSAADLQTVLNSGPRRSKPTGNVKAPEFIALHELFDDIYEEIEDYVTGLASNEPKRSAARFCRLTWAPAAQPRRRGCA